MFFSIQTCSTAATPDDFYRSWTIDTPTLSSSYRVTLPEAVIVESRHGWADAAVLDAHDKAMPYGISDAEPPLGADVRLTRLKCQPATTQTTSAGSQFHCVAANPVERAYGVNIMTWPFARITVDTADGEHTEFLRDTSVQYAQREEPLFFSSARQIEAIDVSVDSVPERGLDATLASLPQIDPGKTNWHQARFLWAERGNKRFVYATDFPVRAFSVRLGLDRKPLESDRFIVMGCDDAPCVLNHGMNALTADPLQFGMDKISHSMHFGTFGSYDPFVQIDSAVPLETPPTLELGWWPPKLIFEAYSGTRPFTLSVGLKHFEGRGRFGTPRQSAMQYGISQAEAGLSDYFPRSQLSSRVLNTSGPLLLVIAILLGLTWAIWPRALGNQRSRKSAASE